MAYQKLNSSFWLILAHIISSSEKFRLCRLHDGRNRWELLSFILITHRAYRIRYINTPKTFSNYLFQEKRHPTMGSHVTHVGNIHGLLTSTMTTENWQLWKLCQQWQLRWGFIQRKIILITGGKFYPWNQKSAVQVHLTKCSQSSEVHIRDNESFIFRRCYNIMNHLSLKSSPIYMMSRVTPQQSISTLILYIPSHGGFLCRSFVTMCSLII